MELTEGVANLFWQACTDIINNLGYVDREGVYLMQKYSDDYIVISGRLRQAISKTTKDMGFALRSIQVAIKQESDNLPVNQNAQLAIEKGSRKSVEGLTSGLFAETQVLVLQPENNKIMVYYYRPGRWQNYILELYQKLEDYGRRYIDLNMEPIDDSKLFPDKYKLDEPKSDT